MARELPTGTVTLLFTDIEGSTRLLDEVGERYGQLLAEHRRLLREVWAEFGGVEVDTEGDAFFVAFPSAQAAVDAAAEGQRRLAAHPWPGSPVRVRMGLHTGEPQVGDEGYWGPDVHYAARVAAAAHGGQVLLSPATRELTRGEVQSLGEHPLKDFPATRELFHLVIDGVGADAFGPPRTVTRGRGNVPVATAPLFGRDGELAELLRHSASEPLVTVTGPGGCGKTRLLVELGRRAADYFDEVWFTTLEQVRDPADVAPAVVRTLGLREQGDARAQLIEHLHGRRALLLLDNVEQVIDAAPDLARLATAGPDVRVVLTSQTPLRVAGERVLRLGALPVPGPATTDPDVLRQVPSVAVLLDRAAALGSPFVLDGANAADVATLCRQLEGMPLALELAASRLDLLGPAGLVRRLDTGLDALGRGRRDLPERQRGLRAMLQWTFDLLDPAAQDLLARLSVFIGGFTVDLLGDRFDDALDGLQALLDASLVERGNGGRLTCRPPVRRFAAELLERDGDPAAAHAAMIDCLAELAEPYEKLWLAVAGEGRLVVNPEATNIVAAIEWADAHDPARHARLVAATNWCLAHNNLERVGSDHVDRALARTTDPRLRARLLQARGSDGFASADPTWNMAAADAWRELGDATGEVMSLMHAVDMYIQAEDAAGAVPVLERATRVAATVPGAVELDWIVDTGRAQVIGMLGQHAEARAILDRQLALAPERSWRQTMTATLRADIALEDGRPAEALRDYAVAMTLFRVDFDSRTGAVIQADTIVQALARLGRLDEAAVGLAVCEYVHADMGWPPRGILATALAEARALLDDDALARAGDRARELGVDGGLEWINIVASRGPA